MFTTRADLLNFLDAIFRRATKLKLNCVDENRLCIGEWSGGNDSGSEDITLGEFDVPLHIENALSILFSEGLGFGGYAGSWDTSGSIYYYASTKTIVFEGTVSDSENMVPIGAPETFVYNTSPKFLEAIVLHIPEQLYEGQDEFWYFENGQHGWHPIDLSNPANPDNFIIKHVGRTKTKFKKEQADLLQWLGSTFTCILDDNSLDCCTLQVSHAIDGGTLTITVEQLVPAEEEVYNELPLSAEEGVDTDRVDGMLENSTDGWGARW